MSASSGVNWLFRQTNKQTNKPKKKKKKKKEEKVRGKRGVLSMTFVVYEHYHSIRVGVILNGNIIRVKTSTRNPPTLNFRVRINVRVKLRFKVRDRNRFGGIEVYVGLGSE